MEDTSRQEEGGVIFFMQDSDKHLTEWARQWVKSHVLASEKSILIYRNSWKERMAQMTNNKTNSIKPAMKLGDNVKALKMCGLISIYLAWRNLKTGFCHALANSAHPLTACRWFNQLCFELAQLASGDLATKTLIQEIVNYQACNETGTKTATPLQMFSQNKFLFAICINFVEIRFASKKNSGESERGVKPLFWGKASNIEASVQVSCMIKERK